MTPLPPEHTHLLRAALLNGEPMQTAWERWQSTVDFDTVDGSAYSVLPLLARNLERHGIDHPLSGRLSGIYRKVWASNQLVLNRLNTVTRGLQTVETPFGWVDDAAFALHYAPEVGSLPMTSAALVVPDYRLATVHDVLLKSGASRASDDRWTFPALRGFYVTLYTVHDADLSMHTVRAASEDAVVLNATAQFWRSALVERASPLGVTARLWLLGRDPDHPIDWERLEVWAHRLQRRWTLALALERLLSVHDDDTLAERVRRLRRSAHPLEWLEAQLSHTPGGLPSRAVRRLLRRKTATPMPFDVDRGEG